MSCESARTTFDVIRVFLAHQTAYCRVLDIVAINDTTELGICTGDPDDVIGPVHDIVLLVNLRKVLGAEGVGFVSGLSINAIGRVGGCRYALSESLDTDEN